MLYKKIKTPQSLKKTIDEIKKRKKKLCFTNGCFDILHYGHIKYLEDAKKYADILIVAVNSDDSVQRLKGKKRPIFFLKDRMRMLAALSSVDYVTWFNEDTPLEIIGYLKPDIIVKGADYKVRDIIGGGTVKSYGGKVKRVKYLKGYSVSGLIDKILKLNDKIINC
jgi:rfaE bifunctional protein nucleotidyltransferase chain/domain